MAKVKLNVGRCKEALAEGLVNLKKNLKDHPPLSLSEKAKYAEAILAMGFALSVLKKVRCDQPDMSFEREYIPKPLRSKGKRGRRR